MNYEEQITVMEQRQPGIKEQRDRLLKEQFELDTEIRQLKEAIAVLKDTNAEARAGVIAEFAIEIEHEVVTRMATIITTPAITTTALPTADTTLQAMGEIMAALTSGKMSGADAKAQLYAHQIALSALRTIDNAKARRQKEERLRKTTNAAPRKAAAATASPRRKSNDQRHNHKATKKKTTGHTRQK